MILCHCIHFTLHPPLNPFNGRGSGTPPFSHHFDPKINPDVTIARGVSANPFPYISTPCTRSHSIGNTIGGNYFTVHCKLTQICAFIDHFGIRKQALYDCVLLLLLKIKAKKTVTFSHTIVVFYLYRSSFTVHLLVTTLSHSPGSTHNIFEV